MPLPRSKVIDRDDFASPELRPYLREVNEQEAVRYGAGANDIVPDFRQWQYAMALRTLDAEGCAMHGRWVAGIGAGTEATIFALARRGVLVFAVDRYLQQSVWSDVAPAGMLIDPSRYSARDVPRGRIVPVHSSAQRLNLPSNSFDGVFCNGLLEHVGSLDDVALAAREIARILKPGGVASIATEFRLEGPADRHGFDDDVILFTPELLRRYVVESSGLVLREPLELRQSDATFETRSTVADFLDRGSVVHGLEEKRCVQPNLVLYHEGFLFCALVLTLHKDREAAHFTGGEAQRGALARIETENIVLAGALERSQRAVQEAKAPAKSHALFGEVERLRTELDWLHAAYDRSNAWKHWRVMLPARLVYRRLKRWRA